MRSRAVINAWTTTVNERGDRFEDGGMVWEDGRIVAVGPTREIKAEIEARKIEEVLDARGAFLFPGLINTHAHFFQHLLKGIGADKPLSAWWHATVSPLARNMTEELLAAAVDGAALESISTGATTVVDYMYAHPRPGLSDVEIERLERSGLRAVYARGFRTTGADRGFPKELIEESGKVFAEIDGLKAACAREDSRLSAWIAPAALWALDERSLKETAEYCRSARTRCTMHILETSDEDAFSLKAFGKRAIEVFEETGMLDTSLLAVHCVKAGEREIEAFRNHGVAVSYNPVSNMYLGSGVAPLGRFLEAGIAVGLGTDGAASNNTCSMIESIKTGALLQKAASEDPAAASARSMIRAATADAARALGMEREIGSLEIGKKADFFIYDPFEDDVSMPFHDPEATLAYSGGTRGVRYTAVDGEYLLYDGNPVRADRRETMERLQKAAEEARKLY